MAVEDEHNNLEFVSGINPAHEVLLEHLIGLQNKFHELTNIIFGREWNAIREMDKNYFGSDPTAPSQAFKLKTRGERIGLQLDTLFLKIANNQPIYMEGFNFQKLLNDYSKFEKDFIGFVKKNAE